jgi:uncharacterized protein
MTVARKITRRTMSLAASLVAVAGCMISTGAAANVGLNCERTTVKVQQRICKDAGLLQLQITMRDLYFSTARRIDPQSDVKYLVADQKRWIARRDSCWTRRCIVRALGQRIETLRSYAVKRDD